MKKQKNILVSFSGGLDSTYLVHQNLKEGCKVTGLYTTIKNNEDKVKVEKCQIDKLTELFKEDFPDQFNLRYGIDIEVYGSPDLYLKQIMIWIMSALYQEPGFDEVHIGAVMNDDLVSYVEEIKKTWETFEFLKEDGLPKLRFPLIKLPKYEIVKLLPERYKKLVVYCESPRIIKPIIGESEEVVFINCGFCNPCERYKYESKKWNYEYGQIHINESDLTRKEMSNLLSGAEISDIEPEIEEYNGNEPQQK